MISDHVSCSQPWVLIVDKSAETREVLKTALQSRGMATMEAHEARQGLDLLRRFHPDVVVLDLETEAADDEILRDEIDCEVQRHHSRLIVLGRARRYAASLPVGQVVAKPYHYAPLIRTIERLCDETARELRAV